MVREVSDKLRELVNVMLSMNERHRPGTKGEKKQIPGLSVGGNLVHEEYY